MPAAKSSKPTQLRLSPSKINSFVGCPMKYRFQYVDSVPRLPAEVALRGNFTHRILELLLQHPAAERTNENANKSLEQARTEFRKREDWRMLNLNDEEAERFWEAAREAVRAYYRIQHPQDADIVALELKASMSLGEFQLAGIIDRVERDNGQLVISDYKGSVPKRLEYSDDHLRQLMLYALMYEFQLKEAPHEVRVYYLGGGKDEYPRNKRVVSQVVTRELLDEARSGAHRVYADIKNATASGEFATKVQKLCDWCDYQQWCPAHDGDPSVATAEATVAVNIRRKQVGLDPLA
jgi:putative RecB family exonuclease